MAKLLKRLEDRRLVTGTASFIDDIKLPNLLHCVFVRSRYAHALIKNIDYSKAEKHPDVVGVFTGDVFIKHMKPIPQAADIVLDDYCIAVDETVYFGQPVAAVVARNYAAALDAAELVDVEYEVMKPVTSIEEGMSNKFKTHRKIDSNVIVQRRFSYGDVDEIFRNAANVVEDTFTYLRHTATPLECYGIIADFNVNGRLTVIDNCQLVGASINVLSSVLSIPPRDIRLIRPDIGGGFGIKSMVTAYEPLIAVLSKLTSKPVKWVETRSEHLMASAHGSERLYRSKIACDASGKILALSIAAFDDVGAFIRPPGTSPVSALRAFNGPYDIRAFEYSLNVVLTNKCPAGPSRGNAKNHHAFVLERLVERARQRIGSDPVSFRLQNLIKPGQFPYVTANKQVYDSGNYPDALRLAAEAIGYGEQFKKRQTSLRENGRFIGIGFAFVVDPAGANSAQQRLLNNKSKALGSSDAVKIAVDNTGVVKVFLGTIPQGQGHETVAVEIVSEILGVPPENVVVAEWFDTFRDPWTMSSGTYSSRFAGITANALILAGQQLREKILTIASKMLDTPVEILNITDGIVRVEGGQNKYVEFADIAKAAYLAGESLESAAVYSHNFAIMNVLPEQNLSTTYGYQVHAALVEVDVETGNVHILRYIVVDDSGRILNHIIKEGQVHGGVFTGISSALYEQIIYGEDGQLLTSTFMDYLPPTAVEIPSIETITIETPSPFTLAGSKGVGETGALAPQAAIINAVEDALSPFDVKISESSIKPYLIWLKMSKKYC
jgi:2-furoyl-CoA dehydrogenase large subunit